MKFEFARNKYSKELLIDCFLKEGKISIEHPEKPFLVSFYEVIVVKQGEGEFKLDDETVHFKRGTVLLLPPDKWRTWSTIHDDFEAIYLIFEEEAISTFFNDALYLYRLSYFHNIHTPSYLELAEGDLQPLLLRLKELQGELGQLRPDSMHFLRAVLYYVLIQLNRTYQETYHIESEIYHRTEILKFKKLLEAHIQAKHKVTDYAQLLGISTSHLNKILKTYLGKSASQIIKERLIIEIKRKLLFTDKSISEISYELNFSEPSNFVRFFQSGVKLSPGEYRIQNDNP